MNYEFRVIVDLNVNSDEEMLDLADTLGNAGCLDSTVGGHAEGVELTFNRESDSLDAALKSAIADVESVGYRVMRIELAREAISE